MLFNTIYISDTYIAQIIWNDWDLDHDMLDVHLPLYADINSSGNSMFAIAKVPLLF